MRTYTECVERNTDQCSECDSGTPCAHGICELCEEYAYLERMKEELAGQYDPRLPDADVSDDIERRFHAGEF